MFEINLYAEASRDREKGDVFWFSTLEWVGHDNHILRQNGIHSHFENSITTNDGGILDAISHALDVMPTGEEYKFNVITKQKRVNLQNTFLNIKSFALNDWKQDIGIYEREINDSHPLKNIYSRIKEIKGIKFISDPQNKIVKQMEEMSTTFKNLYLIEDDRLNQVVDFKKYKMQSLDF